MVEFHFSKVLCFQHIFRTPLVGCVWSMKLFFETHLILDIQTTFRIEKLHFKNFWWEWEYIKNKSCKSYLGNKEQMNVSSWFLMFLDRTCTLCAHFFFFFFFACPKSRALNIFPAVPLYASYFTHKRLHEALKWCSRIKMKILYYLKTGKLIAIWHIWHYLIAKQYHVFCFHLMFQ